jgi:tetratricopeptide (TPR) repeat protein
VEALQGDRRFERFETGPLLSVFAHDRLAWCLAELGEFAEAMARADEADRIAREVDHPASVVIGYRSLGLVSLRRGDLMAAIPPLERSVELCRTIPVPVLLDVSAAYLGYAYALSGRLAEGVALLEDGLLAGEGRRGAAWSRAMTRVLSRSSRSKVRSIASTGGS